MCWTIVLQLSSLSLFVPSPHVTIQTKHPSWKWQKLISILHSSTMKELDELCKSDRADRFLPNFNPRQTFLTTTRNGVKYINRPILLRWASIKNSFFCHFHSEYFIVLYIEVEDIPHTWSPDLKYIQRGINHKILHYALCTSTVVVLGGVDWYATAQLFR